MTDNATSAGPVSASETGSNGDAPVSKAQSGRRHWAWIAGGFALSFAFFMYIGGSRELFRGHDHWLSGQAMMLAQGYGGNGMRTPGMMMMENPVAQSVGWAPYCGWPPLYFYGLAALFNFTGSDLLVARVVSALLMAASLALTTYLAWCLTKRREALWLTPLVFCANRIITRYCTLVFCDVPALTWCLLLLALYPAYLRGRSRLIGLGYPALVCVGALISWQCYMVPVVAAALACLYLREEDGKVNWIKLAVPIAVCMAVGLVLVLMGNHVEHAYTPNSWFPPNADRLSGKFLQRSTLGNPLAAFSHAGNFVYLVGIFSSTSLLLCGAFHAAARILPSRQGNPAAGTSGQTPVQRFYLAGLAAFPLLWLAAMAEMHEHDFQVIFWVPLVAVLIVMSLLGLSSRLRSRRGRGMWWLCVAACFAWAILWHVPKKHTKDDSKFCSMEKAVRDMTAPGTVVVTTVNDRGLWWRLGRQVVGWKRAGEVRERDHVILIDFDPESEPSWKPAYDVLFTISTSKSPYNGYTLLKPKRRAQPTAEQ